MFDFPKPFLRIGAAVLIASAISACGGGSSTPATAVSSTITGNVVKGPVSGATVVIKNASSGATLANTITTASGAYAVTFNFSGDVLIEVTGGSYTDEATARTVTLTAPMRTVLAVNGGTLTGMVTPLTTLAYTGSSSGGNAPSASNFAAAATSIANQFGITGTNIITTLPVVTGSTNAYGKVLVATSTYLNNNSATTSLDTLISMPMSTTAAASFNSAFAVAYSEANGQTVTISYGVSTGSSGGGSSSTAPSNGSPTGTISVTNTALLAPFEGSWVSGCEALTRPALPAGTPGFPNGVPETTYGSTKAIVRFSAPASNGFVLLGSTEYYYLSADCTGNVVATIGEASGDAIATGTTTVGNLSVIKIQVREPSGTPFFTGSAATLIPATQNSPAEIRIVLGNFTTSYPISTTATTNKSILSTISNNTFRVGEDSVLLDLNGYPTTLDTSSSGLFTKL